MSETRIITTLYITSERPGDPNVWMLNMDGVVSIQPINQGEWFRIYFEDGTDYTFHKSVVDSYQRTEETQHG